MSSIFVSQRPGDGERLKILIEDLSFARGSWHEVARTDFLTVVLTRCDQKELWAPAVDPLTQTRALLVGRIALSKEEWLNARTLPYEGGLACRHILHSYLSENNPSTLNLNGAFGLILFSPEEQTLNIITDRFGFFPLYGCGKREDIAFCSHPDVLARHSRCAGELDLTTMAEMIAHGHGVHPYTYYTGVKQLDPGTVYRLDASRKLTQIRYWKPNIQVSANTSVNELASELASSLKTATQKRSDALLGSTGLFLSAGADSRAILYSVADPASIQCFTFYDAPNEELNIAKAIAQSVGSSHQPLQRKFEHYALGAEESVRITGGMWNMLDAHYTGFLSELNSFQIDNYLSGCFADYLFKGIALDRKYKTLFGKNLPVLEQGDFSIQWYFEHAPVSDIWKSKILERTAEMYEDCDLDDNSQEARWEIELARIFPICREATISTRLLLMRTLPWDPVLSDSDILSMYLKIPPVHKLNGQVWEKAVEILSLNKKKIPNNNTHSRIGASETEKIMIFLFGVFYRKIMGKDFGGTALDGLATRGSWPNFYYFLKHSSVLPQLWQKKSFSSDIICDLLGYDPWKISLNAWADKNTQLFYRLLTLKLWLDQR